MNTKKVGNDAELNVAAWLQKEGFTVSFPFGDNAPYDLIVESDNGKVSRIQVRRTNWSDDGWLQISLRGSSGGKTRSLEKDRIEAFVVFDGTNFFVVPTSHMLGQFSTYSLRRTPPKNNQTKGIHLAEQYQNAVQLLR